MNSLFSQRVQPWTLLQILQLIFLFRSSVRLCSARSSSRSGFSAFLPPTRHFLQQTKLSGFNFTTNCEERLSSSFFDRPRISETRPKLSVDENEEISLRFVRSKWIFVLVENVRIRQNEKQKNPRENSFVFHRRSAEKFRSNSRNSSWEIFRCETKIVAGFSAFR